MKRVNIGEEESIVEDKERNSDLGNLIWYGVRLEKRVGSGKGGWERGKWFFRVKISFG